MRKGRSIAIRQDFSKRQVRAYGVELAKSEPLTTSAGIAEVREGFSCNVHSLSLTPHCHGTHTEGIGHLSREKHPLDLSISECVFEGRLISVDLKKSSTSNDSYSVELDEQDLVIDEEELRKHRIPPTSVLVVRTLPNDISKQTRDYDASNSGFFSIEGMRYIRSLGIKHLLVDLPSLDRMNDEGHLICHRIFFGIEPGSTSASEESLERSITELIYVPNDLVDGAYKVQIQLPAIVLEAVPSNPILFPI